MDGKTALVFFLGLFWATSLSSVTKFRPFDTAAWFRGDGWKRGMPRFLAGILIANVLPLVELWLLYSSDRIVPHGQVSADGIFAAAFASLSVFCIPRLLHAFIATKSTYKWFYDKEDWEKVIADTGAKPDDSFWAHFLPGIGYILFFIIIAWAVQRVF